MALDELSHLAADIQPDELARRHEADDRITETFVWRLRGEVARFFAGLDLVEPGIVALDG